MLSIFHKFPWAGFLRPLLIVLFVVSPMVHPGDSLAQKARIAVIYPNYPAPYNAIYDEIISGIERGNINLSLIPVDEGGEVAAAHIFEIGNFDGAIALGQRGLDVFPDRPSRPVVVGAVPWIPDHLSGVSLATDPQTTFSLLETLVPSVKKIFVVYSEEAFGPMIPKVLEAARGSGLELISLEAGNLRSALRKYREVLNQSKPGDAIWLPLDWITVENRHVLPMLLEEAWDKQLILFSNKPSHSRSGALFALFPDNVGHGEEIADAMELLLHNPEQRINTSTKSLSVGVNTRTATHLGLSFTKKQRELFDFVFPVK